MASKVKDIEKSSKVSTFMKNIGKSFKIIAADVFEKENLIPQTRKQFKVYNEYFNDVKLRRNEKKDLIQSSRQLNRTRIYDSSNKFMDKAWDELKNNPIYENDREKDYFEDEEDEVNDVSTSDLNESIQNSGKATSTMIGRVGEIIISNMRISDNLQKNNNMKLLNSITQGFGITNNFLDKIESNTSQLNSHMSNSKVFYENMLNLQKQSVEIQMSMYEAQNAINNKNSYAPNTAFDRVYGKGYFDFREYFKEIGTNLTGMLSANQVTSGIMYKIVNPILSTNLSKLKTNPIETIVSLGMRLAIRNIGAVESFTTKLSETIDNFFPNLLSRIANLSASSNPIIQKIVSNPTVSKILGILGLKTQENKTIDPGKYDKGPVQFDGTTRRTIVKTIPEYLARIEAAITGGEERYMDPISGKWITKSKIKERNNELLDMGYNSASKNIKSHMNDAIKAAPSANVLDPKTIEKVVDAFLRERYDTGKLSSIDMKVGGSEREALYKKARNMGLTAQEASIIVKAFDSQAVRDDALGWAFNVNKAKNEQNKFVANQESLGYGTLSNRFDDSGIDPMAKGGTVAGKRGEPTLAIMTAGEKVVNTFGPKQTAENIQKEQAYAQMLGLNAPAFAEGTNAGAALRAKVQSAKDLAKKGINKVKEKGTEFLDMMKSGDMADIVTEFAPKADRNKVQKILDKTAAAIPRGLKGAGIGGIIGLFTGMPLVGLTVGSGIGIASVSDTVKGFLFGKDEVVDPETGEVKSAGRKGVIPKSWVQFAKNAFPKAKLGGIVGGIAGLLTGGIGILPAAVIGAGVGTALSSQKVTDFLFGKRDENGEVVEDTGIIKKKVQDYIKKHAPGMGIGAAGGIVATLLGAGPFGMLGNAVLGAGASLIVTSDKFKDFMLGKVDENGNRTGGLLGDLKLRFVDPLSNAAKELIEEGKKFFKVNVFDNIKKFVGTAGTMITNIIADGKNFLANMFNNGSVPIDETIGSYTRGAINFGKKVLSAPVKLVAGAATLPFRALGGISNRMTDRMVSRGNASNMTAQERLNYRRTRKGKLGRYSDDYAQADKTLANASLEDLRKLQVVSDLGGPNIEGFTEQASEVIHRFTSYLLSNQMPIKESNVRKLQKDIAHGDSKAFSKDLNAIRELSSDQKEDIYNAFWNDIVVLQDIVDKQGELRQSQDRSMRYIKETFGIKGKFDRRSLGRFNRSLSKEIAAREAQAAADKAKEEDKTNFIDPNGNQYENAFRNTVSEKLNELIRLLNLEVDVSTEAKEDAKKAIEEQQTLYGKAGLTKDDNGNLSVRENETVNNARDKFDFRNSITRFRENLRDKRRSFRNQLKIGFKYGFGVSRNLMQDKDIDMSNLDKGLVKTLAKLNLKINSKTVGTVGYIIKNQFRDQILELISIIKTKGLFDLNTQDIINLNTFIANHQSDFSNVVDYFDLVFKKGKFRLGSSNDLIIITNEDKEYGNTVNISDDGLSTLQQNLKYIKFTGKNADPNFVVECTNRIIDIDNKEGSPQDYDRVNRLSGKLFRAGKKLTKVGKQVLAYGKQAMFGKRDKDDDVNNIFDFVKNYGVIGGLKTLMTGDENSNIKFLKEGGLFGAIKGGAKNVVGFFFGKDKDGETIFQRHGLLGYIPAAIFGDEKSPGLLGNTLLGKGVKIFGKILKGLLIAAIATPIIGQFANFIKSTLKPVWNTVIRPWWNEHITQPLKERFEKIKVTLFGTKKVKDPETGEEYYEGGLLSGPLNAINKPITKIHDYIEEFKSRWHTVTEKAGTTNISGVLKYLLIGQGPLLTVGNDGAAKSNGSIIGNAVKWIRDGYKYFADNIVIPIKNFFTGIVKPWIENTAAPWLSGLLQTLFHNINPFSKDKWEDYSSDTLISRGGGEVNTPSPQNGNNQDRHNTATYNPSNYYYDTERGGVIDNRTGNLVDEADNPEIYEEFNYNGYKITAPGAEGFILKNNAKITITPINNYIDADCDNIYLIKGTYGTKNSNKVNAYYKKITNSLKQKIYTFATPVSSIGLTVGEATDIFNTNLNPDRLNNFAKLVSGKNYQGKQIYYCVNNETYYTKNDDNTKLVVISPSLIKENKILNTRNTGGRSRNSIYQKIKKFKDYTNEVDGGFVNNDGSTSINYFTSMFNGTNTTNKNDVKENLKNNKPVVLLGKDDTNGVYGSNKENSGKARNHIYQKDQKIKNVKYGKSTIGDAGCGPVAAANLMGGALDYATQYAQDGGFVNNDGSTSINYFTSMFNGTNTTNKNDVKENLKNNKPVVLLGKDDTNGVYGSNNHFVTAKGFDNKGRVIVEDPDLPQSSMKYPADKVFKGMKAASLIGGKDREDEENNGPTISGIFNKFGNLASLIFKKTFGVSWDDIFGSKETTSETSTPLSADEYYNSNGTTINDNTRYDNGKTFTISGNQRTRFLSVAQTQVGYTEGSNNDTKYGRWYNLNNNAWCVMFVSWCANKAGIPTSIIPKAASTTVMRDWFDSNNRLYYRNSGYIPQPGDIVFFGTDSSRANLEHTGIVEGVAGNSLLTIEGNYSDKVTRRRYDNYMINPKIHGFASPDFKEDNRTIRVEGIDDASVDVVEDHTGKVVYAAPTVKKTLTKETPTTTKYDASNPKQKMWKFLRDKVGLSTLGASGLFGVWENESGLNPKTVEGFYLKDFPGYDAIKTNAGLNNFTNNVLFPAYDNNTDEYGNPKPIKVNKDAYLVNGNLYPGLGLAQWTGPRGKDLFDYAKNNGYSSIWDTDAQLNFAKNEFDKRYPALVSKLNATTSPKEAAKVALDGYEMHSGFADNNPNEFAKRASSAAKYYEEYKGLGRNTYNEISNQRNKQYRGSSNPISYGPQRSINTDTTGRVRESYVSYDEFLETIIQILLDISNNTTAVNKILEVLSQEGGNLSAKAREDISKAVSSSNNMDALKNALKHKLAGQSTGISSMIGNSRTDLIIKTMKEIAAQ